MTEGLIQKVSEILTMREYYKNWTIAEIIIAVALCTPLYPIIYLILNQINTHPTKYYWQTEHYRKKYSQQKGETKE